jgi:hypothetical protein
LDLLQLSLQLQGHASGAPSRSARAMLAEDTWDVHEESLNDPGKCRATAARVVGVSPQVAGQPARASSAEAHRRGPLPAAPLPRARRSRAPPLRTVGRAFRASCPGRRATCADRPAKGHSHRAGTPRIVRLGPSSLNGAPRPRCARTRLRRAVDPGDLCRPAGLTARARPQARPEARAANLAPDT